LERLSGRRGIAWVAVRQSGAFANALLCENLAGDIAKCFELVDAVWPWRRVKVRQGVRVLEYSVEDAPPL